VQGFVIGTTGGVVFALAEVNNKILPINAINNLFIVNN